MRFLDRQDELRRLDGLLDRGEGRFGVVYGRRRVGKTRLLVEWVEKRGGLYSVADQSAPDLQRQYLAGAIAQVFPGFGDVRYPEWASLLERLASEARAAGWTGPLVLDELPYLILTSPELPSLLQRWLDHDARRAGLVVAVAGSSQRMMQGLVLSAEAPMFGRAHEVLELQPLPAAYLSQAFRTRSPLELIQMYAAWGGIPRYWELALDASGTTPERIAHLVLDPLGPLHREPDRLLLEEIPSAVELRPLLDAIGSGAHRASEIAGRIGRPATALARPLQRLQQMGLVRRETPFGEPEGKSKRSLYRLADPFLRLWFRVVVPNRAQLVAGTRSQRRAILDEHWPRLVASAWEDLCRASLPDLAPRSPVGRLGPWQPGQRWWHGNQPEWDVVSVAPEQRRVLLGEVKWSSRPFPARELERQANALRSKRPPELPAAYREHEATRVLFIPELAPGIRREVDGILIASGRDVLRL